MPVLGKIEVRKMFHKAPVGEKGKFVYSRQQKKDDVVKVIDQQRYVPSSVRLVVGASIESTD